VVATHSYVHDGNRCRKIRDLNKLNVEDALAIVEIEAMSSKSLAAAQVDRKIVLSRGERVMLDADLAALYEVETRSLVQARSEQVLPYGLAAMMLITPSGWTLTEATREVRLPR
jgi:hypothetical protein